MWVNDPTCPVSGVHLSDERVDGDHVLLSVPVSALPESEWSLHRNVAEAYAARSTPFPPVVVDARLSFVDGGHRHLSARLRGDRTIRAFVPVVAAPQLAAAPILGA